MADGLFNNESLAAIIGGACGGMVSLVIAILERRKTRIWMAYEAVEAVLDELECVSKKYWRDSGKKPDDESQIKSLLERLDLRVESFLRQKNSNDFSTDVRARIDDISETISGGLFESVARRPDFVRVRKIKEKLSDFRDRLNP